MDASAESADFMARVQAGMGMLTTQATLDDPAEEWRDIAFTLVGLLSRICDLVETERDVESAKQ